MVRLAWIRSDAFPPVTVPLYLQTTNKHFDFSGDLSYAAFPVAGGTSRRIYLGHPQV